MCKIFAGIAVSLLMLSCSHQQTVVFFEAFGVKVDSVHLKTENEIVSVKYDSAHVAQLVLKDFQKGYVQLQFGRISRLVYLERGKDLYVSYKRTNDGRRPLYSFRGRLRNENNWLCMHERMPMVDFKEAHTSADAIGCIEKNIQLCKQSIKEQDFSPSFVALECKRETIATLRCCRNYSAWDSLLYPFLRKHVQCMPELFMCDEYKRFVLESLGALASEYHPDMYSYEYTRSQLDYIAEIFQEPSLCSYFASEVTIACMEMNGARYISELRGMVHPLICVRKDWKNVKKVFRKWERVAPGETVDDYTFADMDNNIVKLSDFRGHYVFIDCWATWCGPCRSQIRPLQELEEKYKDRNIVFMGVSSDSDRDKWKKFVKDNNLPGLQVNASADAAFYEHFAVGNIPRFIVLNPDGSVYDAMFPRPSESKCSEMLDEILD